MHTESHFPSEIGIFRAVRGSYRISLHWFVNRSWNATSKYFVPNCILTALRTSVMCCVTLLHYSYIVDVNSFQFYFGIFQGESRIRILKVWQHISWHQLPKEFCSHPWGFCWSSGIFELLWKTCKTKLMADTAPENLLGTLGSICSFFTLPCLLLQSNLATRNFLVTLKLFLNAESSLLQTLNQSTI